MYTDIITITAAITSFTVSFSFRTNAASTAVSNTSTADANAFTMTLINFKINAASPFVAPKSTIRIKIGFAKCDQLDKECNE